MNHVTLNTGHSRLSPRSEVSDVALQTMRPWLEAAIQSGQPRTMPAAQISHHTAQALASGGDLVVTVFGPAGPHVPGKPPPAGAESAPVVTFGVSRTGGALWGALARQAGVDQPEPAAPWCAVWIHESAMLHPDALEWMGDFERCVAWAWLEEWSP